jgi:hypothetical protein
MSDVLFGMTDELSIREVHFGDRCEEAELVHDKSKSPVTERAGINDWQVSGPPWTVDTEPDPRADGFIPSDNKHMEVRNVEANRRDGGVLRAGRCED